MHSIATAQARWRWLVGLLLLTSCVDLDGLRELAHPEDLPAGPDGGNPPADGGMQALPGTDASQHPPGSPDAGGRKDAGDRVGPRDGAPDSNPDPNPGQNDPPRITVFFPQGGRTDREEIVVRGQVIDPEGDAVPTVELSAGDADPVEVTPTASGSFTATVPLELGSQDISVRAQDEHGHAADTAIGPIERYAYLFGNAAGIVFDPAAERLLALDAYDLSLAAIDLTDGSRERLSSGTAPPQTSADLALDREHDRVLIADPGRHALISVSLSGGERTTLSGPGTASGPDMVPTHVAVDGFRGFALALQQGTDVLIEVNLTTGQRAQLSTTGDRLMQPQDIVIDASGTRAIISDSGREALVAVNLTSGQRSLLSGATRGRGPALSSIGELTLDPAHGRALVLQRRASGLAILEVNLTTGDRRLAADLELGAAPPVRDLNAGPALAYDTQADRLLVLCSSGRLFAVDLAPGARRVVIDSQDADGAEFHVGALGVGGSSNAYIAGDAEGEIGIYDVELFDGSRTLVSSADLGDGPDLGSVAAVTSGPGSAVIVFSDQGVFDVDYSSGRRFLLESSTGPALGPGLAAVYDIVGDRVIAAAGDPVHDLIAIDFATGDRSVFSSASVGTGPAIDAQALALDHPHNRVLAAGKTEIVAVDLTTGNRTLISNASTRAGPALQRISGLALDPFADRVFVADAAALTVLAVDLVTGDRSVISGAGQGAGPALEQPGQLIAFPQSSELFLQDAGRMLGIELLSRQREVLADQQRGSGTDLQAPVFVLDPRDRGKAFVAAEQEGNLFVSALDLRTGDRTPANDFIASWPELWSLSIGPSPDSLLLLKAEESYDYGVRQLELATGLQDNLGDLTADDLPVDVEWDAERERAIVALAGRKALLPLGTSPLQPLAGDGPELEGMVATCIDGPNDRILALCGAKLIAVDLETGDRTLISGTTVGAGPELARPTALACDLEAGRVLVADDGQQLIMAIDLETGERHELAPLPRPPLPPERQPASNFDYDPESEVAYVVGQGAIDAVWAVDTRTGESLLIAGSGR